MTYTNRLTNRYTNMSKKVHNIFWEKLLFQSTQLPTARRSLQVKPGHPNQVKTPTTQIKIGSDQDNATT